MEETHYREPRTPLVPPGEIDCHVRDMTATVSSAVTLAQLQAKLAEYDQWLPIDGDAQQTVGALVACDSTGPLRLGYGAWRDLLLGVQFVNGQGQLITAGGRTVKNVAGYDLTKFMVGQRGIFGQLTTLTTRTYRRPSGAMMARYAPDVKILRELISMSTRPQWAVLTREALLCGYLGDEATLRFYQSALVNSGHAGLVGRSLAQDIQHRADLWKVDGQIVFRASVPPTELGEFVNRIGNVRWVADAAFGIVLGGISTDAEIASVREAASGLTGNLRFFRGQYGAVLELSTNPAERQIIDRLKRAFDPDSKLNPLPWRPS